MARSKNYQVTIDNVLLAGMLFTIIAALYSSVGHAGASGYLAIMALLSFSPETIKPTSLVLNIVVALIASVKFIKEGCFNKKVFSSFIISSLPMAFFGGSLTISSKYFKLAAGLFLIVSAFLLIFKQFLKAKDTPVKVMPLSVGLTLGSIIGFISGLIGVGGGIFLSPIVILGNWATTKDVSGVAALFILFNSIAGLFGHLNSMNYLEPKILYWIIAVSVGGFLGSCLGSKKFDKRIITLCLFVVLISAGIKFVFID